MTLTLARDGEGRPAPAGASTAERPHDPRARVERIVHEAMLTMRTLALADQARARSASSCWPAYLYEHDDYGVRASLGELRALRAPWRPSARHVTEMERVLFEWLAATPPQPPRRPWPEPPLLPWQWTLLELRAFMAIFNRKGGWRGLAEVLAQRPHMPSYSHTRLRYEHKRLIDRAYARAVELGH